MSNQNSAKTKLVYILSSRYSGSTLLSFVLGAHPEISTIGELKKFHPKMIAQQGKAKYCSCGKAFSVCEFWLELLQTLKEKYPEKTFQADFSQFEFFKNKSINHLFFKICLQFSPKHFLAFFSSSLKTKLQHFLDYNYTIINAVKSNYNKNVFLDSSKPLKNLIYLSLDKRYDLYVIHLIRDPRGQVNSSLKYNNWTVEKTAKKWIEALENNLSFLDKNQLKYSTILYEEFCRNPEIEIAKISKFMGLSDHFNFGKFRTLEQHIMGNYKMRLGKETKIEERLDWINQLSAQDRLTIERMTQAYKQYYTNSVN